MSRIEHLFQPSFSIIVLVMALVLLAVVAIPVRATVYNDYYGSYGGDRWSDWKDDYRDDYLTNNKSHATPPFAPRATFGGCYISENGKLLDDLDCDKVVDINDNCLGVPNPAQADQNKNGLGDACDLVVDKIVIDPPVVQEGRAFLTTATLTNYRSYDIRNLELRIQVPELGLEQVKYVDILKSGDQGRYEFFLRLPDCVKQKDYDAVLFVEWPKSPGLVESFYIPFKIGVSSSGWCESDGTKKGKSIINILDIQDIDPILGGVYPFTIVNNEDNDMAYTLSVEGTDGWGSYEFLPRSLIVVPKGESRKGTLTIFADKGATGEHGFTVTLRSNKDAQQVMLSARIKQKEPGPSSRLLMQIGIFAVGLVILLLAVALMAGKKKKR